MAEEVSVSENDTNRILDEFLKVYPTPRAAIKTINLMKKVESGELTFKEAVNTARTQSDADIERAVKVGERLGEKRKREKDLSDLSGVEEKKYTGGKVGDKYYGGGPVYPRPAKEE